MGFSPFPNRVRHTVSGTPGTGNITLSTAVSGFQSLSNSSAIDGATSGTWFWPYEIDDASGVWEYGYGSFTLSSGTWTITRYPLESSSGLQTAATLTSAAQVSVTLSGQEVETPATGYRNKFRNPGMDIAQRGTSGTMTTSGGYTLDGWIVTPTGASVSWAQEYCANMKGNALRLSCSTSITACQLVQRIESHIAVDLLTDALGFQPVTVQWLIYNNTGHSFTPQVKVGYASAQDNFATVDADLAAVNLQACPNGALTRVSYTFVPGNVGYTNGVQVTLLLGAALEYSSGYIDIGRADIRATPNLPYSSFLNYCPPVVEVRSIQAELAFCQRYFETTYGNGVAPGTATEAGALETYVTDIGSGGQSNIRWSFAAQKRAVPTCTCYSPSSGTSGKLYNNQASSDETATNGPVSTPGVYSCSFYISTGGTSNLQITAHMTASAEL